MAHAQNRYLSVPAFLDETEPGTLEFALNPLEVIEHFEQMAYDEFADPPFGTAPANLRGVYPNRQIPLFPYSVLEKILPVNPV